MHLHVASPLDLHGTHAESEFILNELCPGVLQQSPQGAMFSGKASLQSGEMWHCGVIVATVKSNCMTFCIFTEHTCPKLSVNLSFI